MTSPPISPSPEREGDLRNNFTRSSKMKKVLSLSVILSILTLFPILSQTTPQRVTDSNTPLHALQPDYPVPYGPAKAEDITVVLNRLYSYLDASTPAKVIDSKTKAEITDMSGLTQDAIFEQGVFRLISYEWGVTYGAMLAAAYATNDTKFREYVLKRINLIADVADYFKKITPADQTINSPVRSVINPRALDDAGSMCAAMIKTYTINKNESLRPYIDNYIDYISNTQLRLGEGTLARNRPLPNSLWLDDLYMSVPALAHMGKLTGMSKYFDDACKQGF